MDDGKLTGVIFLNIRKAFDSINHKILLKKMKDQFGISGFELKRFESYLTNREQVCSVGGQHHLEKIICGVPQGSILGPLMLTLRLQLHAYCMPIFYLMISPNLLEI